MTPNRSPIGLDLHADALRAVQLVAPDATRPTVAGTLVMPRRNDDPMPDVDEFKRFVAALQRRGFSGRDLVVAAPSDAVATSVIAVPRPTRAEDLPHRVGEELLRATHWDPAANEIAWWEIGASGRGNANVDVMAVACPHPTAEALFDLVDASGLNLRAIDIAGAAAQRWSHATTASDPCLALVEFTWSAMRVVAMHDDLFVYERSIPECGIASLFEAAERETSLSADLLELALRPGPDDASHLPFARCIAAHVDLAVRELGIALSYVVSRYPALNGRRVTVIGRGATIPGLVEGLDEQLPVAIGRPAADGPDDDLRRLAPEFAVPAGLALYPAESLA